MSIAIIDTADDGLDTFEKLTSRAYEYLDGAVALGDFNNYTSLVEGEINRRLALKPVRPQMTRVPLTIASEFVSRPTDLQKPISLEMTVSGVKYPVDFVDPINMAVKADDVNDYTRPVQYTIEGSDFRFYPAPAISYAASLLYFKKLPALTTETITNWFLLDHPDVYLYGVLYHAYLFLPDDERAAAMWTLFDSRLSTALEAYPKAPNLAKLRPSTDMSRLLYRVVQN